MQSSRDAVLENTNLMSEILLRLPVKYVLRCKCLSKEWFKTITTPEFRNSHTLRMCQNSSPSLLIHTCKHTLQFQIIYLSNTDENPSPIRTCEFDNYLFNPNLFINIMQSCNGFILFKATYCIQGIRVPCCSNQHQYNIFNPITRKFSFVGFPSESFKDKIVALYFAFEPLRSPYFKFVSFRSVSDGNWGWDSIIKDPRYSPKKFKVNLFSSETSSWGEDILFIGPPNMHVDSGVYCNGAIYWYISGGNSIYFDVGTKCFNTLPYPTFIDYNNNLVKYFGESKGHLHLILVSSDESVEFDILELKKDISGWVIRYHVDLNLIEGCTFSQHGNLKYSVLCVVHQAKEEDSMLVLFIDSKILSYNLKNHTSRIVYEVDDVGESFQYFETLSNILDF
ncbi:putative F-box domain-containing protein [Lupinus albus]|uniref:Putative F-box domain-containing protein n=1 Tax=Lupinus albus TaxID=3870 RepID=A0A6A4PF24_LUPAL|nr:putative F-box domain-containing protein [Lupinus albus]